MLSAVRVWSIAALARTMLVVGCVERPGQYEIRFQQVRAEDISRVLKDVAEPQPERYNGKNISKGNEQRL